MSATASKKELTNCICIVMAKISKNAAIWYFVYIPAVPVCVISKFITGELTIACLDHKQIKTIVIAVIIPRNIEP